jgi:hypothetical protein
MTLEQVVEHNMPNKNKRGTRTMFSRYDLHLRLQAIKLLASLTYSLKIPKGQSTPHPNSSHNLLLINIQHCVELSGCCGCWWHLKLLLESGNHHCHLLKLEVLLLNVVLEVYNRVSAIVHLHVGEV